jgi:hypothetical protein
MSETTAERIIDGMRATLASFEPGPSGRALEQLVTHLSMGIDAIDGLTDEGWLRELRSLWWPLEYVNANALSDNRDRLSADEVSSIESVCAELSAFLERYA